MKTPTKRNSRNIIQLIPALLMATPITVTGTIIHYEGFETDGEGLRYFSTTFSDGADDYFIRTDGTSGASGIPAFTGFTGDFFWAAEDIDGPANTHPDGLAILDIFNIAISGIPEIRITIDMAAGSNAIFDSVNDFVFVQYRVDASPWTNALAFQNDGLRYNSSLHQDVDFDGIGDGEMLTLDMRTFSSAGIVVAGSSLDLRIDVGMDAGSESVAFDSITVIAVPEPSTYAALLSAFASLMVFLKRFRSSNRRFAVVRA